MATRIGAILRQLGIEAPSAPQPPAAETPTTPDCEPWCAAGKGARRVASEPNPATDRVLSYVETVRSARYEYCSCEAGQGAQRLHQVALSGMEEAIAQRNAERLLEATELPPALRRYTLDDYLALPDAQPALPAKLRRWQTAARASGPAVNMLIRGDIGQRKTTLAAALVREELDGGRSALFLVTDDYLARIRASYGKGATDDDKLADEWRLVQAAATPWLLVLDDVADLSDWARGILFRLLNQREAWERPTIITTNLTTAKLEEQLGKRTFDRFRGGAIDPRTGERFVIALEGDSRRGLHAVRSSSAEAQS